MTRYLILQRIGALTFAASLLAAWQLLAYAEIISPIFFPAPTRSLSALWEMIESGKIWYPLGSTIQRMSFGWLAASICGVLLGAVIGSSPRLRMYLEPTLEFLRPLPASAIIPAAILLLGLGQSMAISVIAFGSIWPVLLASVYGFKTRDPRLTEVAQSLEISWIRFQLKIALPAAMPSIFAGLRVSLSVALILAVVVEMQGGQQGLGQNILLAQRNYRSADLYAGIFVLGMLGLSLNSLLSSVERRVIDWKHNRR
jgi:sulfonate transport system permease protein